MEPLVWVAAAVLAVAALSMLVRRRLRAYTRSELDRSRQAIPDARARVDILVSQSHVALWVVDIDLNLVWLQGRAMEELGVDVSSVLGSPIASLLEVTDPDDPSIQAYHRALAGEPSDFDVEWAGRHWEVHLRPLVEQGRITGVIGAGTDVTHHRATESRLEEQTAHFRNLFEEAPEAILLADETDRILEANPEFTRMFGYTREEAVGSYIRELITLPGHEDDSTAITRRVADGERIEIEAMRRRKDGSPIHVSLLAKPVVVRGRHLVYGIYRDITEQKNLESRLLHSQRLEAIGQLAGGVAHDFNNILTAILGHTRLILNDLPPESDLRPDLEHVESAARRAADLTRQLLTFSRRESVQREPVDLNRVVRETQDLLDRLIEERIEVVYELEDALPHVWADAGQLQQILMNLVINSRDAMPKGGNIIVSTHRARSDVCVPSIPSPAAECVVLTVRDDGEGMTDEQKARIFEPFYTTKQAGKGTGLGLSTVYGIVEQSGGAIGVESEPSVGTTVAVILPALEHGSVELPSRTSRRAEPPVAPASGERLILLVDDDNAVREVTRQILARAGYRVVTADSGESALDYFDTGGSRPDLVLTDVVMPGISGVELARALRARDPGIRILLMTGYSEPAAGGVGEIEAVIRKPFDAMTLLRLVRERAES